MRKFAVILSLMLASSTVLAVDCVLKVQDKFTLSGPSASLKLVSGEEWLPQIAIYVAKLNGFTASCVDDKTGNDPGKTLVITDGSGNISKTEYPEGHGPTKMQLKLIPSNGNIQATLYCDFSSK